MTPGDNLAPDTRLAFRDGLQIAWDATSLSCLKECPRKYQYQIVQNWTGYGQNKDIDFGHYFHLALEEYHKHVQSETSHHAALLSVVRATLERTGTRDTYSGSCPQCDSGQTGFIEALPGVEPELSGYHFHCKSCGLVGDFREGVPPTRFVPWDSDDTAKNRRTLVRSIVWYLDQYGKNDPFTVLTLADGRPAVELSFRLEIDLLNPFLEPYYFCGHLDLVGELGGQTYILDHKTTGTTLSSDFFTHFSPDNQMSLYTFAGQVIFDRPIAGVVIDAAQIAVGFTRFARGFASRTPKQIDEWYRDAVHYIKQAEYYHHEDYYPMNDRACFRCQFKKICGRDPAVRSIFLKAEFNKREGWDPLRVR